MATTYFDKIAAGRGLTVRATFRGPSPQKVLSVKTAKVFAPTAFRFRSGGRPRSATRWEDCRVATDVPEVSDGYPAA